MRQHTPEFIRFLINGLTATAIHFAVLNVNMTLLAFPSAGLANFVAALFGVSASFLGNYFYVFPGRHGQIGGRLIRFLLLYGIIAMFHGAALWLWSDRAGLDFRAGFVIATGIQVGLTYLGNKHLVFR